MGDFDEWAGKAQAIADLNNLCQGKLMSAEYVAKANGIFSVLGAEYSSVLATKFVDGLEDNHTKDLIDSQFNEVYNFPEVIRAYAKSTKALRRREIASQKTQECHNRPFLAGFESQMGFRPTLVIVD
ncbi:hypothetical protein BGX38DRAFT_1281039 [Terfezia claveryi]|nr:hypothetical protein BGX38DRAFT_1281039 [Terfezia claveryi]